MNRIFNEDCLDTINRNLDYDYVITSPPDFNELGWDVNPTTINQYKSFLKERLSGLNPSTRNITIFMRDRKDNGINLKNHWLCEIMQELGYNVSYRGIWVKSFKKNLFRLTFTDIHTFSKKGNRKNTKLLEHSFYVPFVSAGSDYTYNYPKEIITKFIKHYTHKGETVYDPFIGSGTTMESCYLLDRDCIGSEIDSDVYDRFLVNHITQSQNFFI